MSEGNFVMNYRTKEMGNTYEMFPKRLEISPSPIDTVIELSARPGLEFGIGILIFVGATIDAITFPNAGETSYHRAYTDLFLMTGGALLATIGLSRTVSSTVKDSKINYQ